MSLSHASSAECLPTVRQRLREATQPWHDRLESTAFARAPFASSLTRADYAAHLSAWFAVIAPLEERMARCFTLSEANELGQSDWQYMPRHVELARDLDALDMTHAAASVVPWPSRRLPASPWEALGAAYVLEGSRLGGQVIAQQLRKQLGESVPLAYYGGDLAQWRRFLPVLETDETRKNVERVTAGAVNTFCGIHECVCAMPQPRAA